jgi:hypothetical protein
MPPNAPANATSRIVDRIDVISDPVKNGKLRPTFIIQIPPGADCDPRWEKCQIATKFAPGEMTGQYWETVQ